MVTFIFWIFLISILFGIVSISSFLRKVVSVFNTANNKKDYTHNQSYKNDNSTKSKKIFGNNEGKYIAYEEIKD